MGPSAATVSSCQAFRASGSMTSQVKAWTSLRQERDISSRAASSAFGSRAQMETRQPSRASASAAARPIPFDAAATIATRPLIARSMAGSGSALGQFLGRLASLFDRAYHVEGLFGQIVAFALDDL